MSTLHTPPKAVCAFSWGFSEDKRIESEIVNWKMKDMPQLPSEWYGRLIRRIQTIDKIKPHTIMNPQFRMMRL